MKYELTTESIIVNGVTLYRIKALKDFGRLKKGDLGGFVESEKNLSQEGDAQIAENTKVFGFAEVKGHAIIKGDITVSGNAKISGDNCIYGSATIIA